MTDINYAIDIIKEKLISKQTMLISQIINLHYYDAQNIPSLNLWK